MSRRGLFGLGLARVGERLEAPPPPPARSLSDVRRRWEEAYDPLAAARLWAPVLDELRAPAPDSVSLFGPQCSPDGRGAIRGLFRDVRPGGVVGFSVWTSGAVVRLLRVASTVDPPPPGLAASWAWGRRERLRQDLDHVAEDVEYRRMEVEVALEPDGALDALGATVPPLGAALRVRGGREQLDSALRAELPATGDRLVVPVLLVSARRR